MTTLIITLRPLVLIFLDLLGIMAGITAMDGLIGHTGAAEGVVPQDGLADGAGDIMTAIGTEGMISDGMIEAAIETETEDAMAAETRIVIAIEMIVAAKGKMTAP